MGACPSDLAGPECGGPPASTDELKEKQAKVRDAGVKATAAKKGLSVAETKLSGLQSKLSVTQEELDGADLRIAQKGEKVASAKPERKPAALQEVEIEKAKKDRLKAEKDRLDRLISSLEKDIAKLKTTSTDAETELTTAKQDLSSAIQRASDEAAAKKAAEEAAAAEAKRIEQQKADEAAAEAERLRQEEEVKAAAEAERLRQEASVVSPKLSTLVDVLNSYDFSEDEIKQAARSLGQFKEDAINNIDYVKDEAVARPANADNVTYELKDTGLFSRDEISKILSSMGAPSDRIKVALDKYLPLNPGQLRRAAMEVPAPEQPPTPFQPLEIPEGLTPEQERRVRMGGPIPASAVTPLPPPPPPPSETTPGRERLDVLKQQSLNLNPLITKLFQYNFTEDQIRQTLKVLGITDNKIDRDIAEVSPTVEKNSLPRNLNDIVKTLRDIKISPPQIRRALRVGLNVPLSDENEAMKGGRKTRRRRRGGNGPNETYKPQKERTEAELKQLPPVSPVVRGDLVKKGSLPKGGRRRTFRKKKTLRELEKKLDELKELISRSS